MIELPLVLSSRPVTCVAPVWEVPAEERDIAPDPPAGNGPGTT